VRRGVFGEGLPGWRCFAVDLDRADEHQALHASSSGLARQIQRGIDIDAAKFGQRVGTVIAHDVDTCRQMQHTIDALQRGMPDGLSVHVARHKGPSTGAARRRRPHCCAHRQTLCRQRLTERPPNQAMGSGDKQLHNQPEPRSWRYTGELKNRNILNKCQRKYLILLWLLRCAW